MGGFAIKITERDIHAQPVTVNKLLVGVRACECVCVRACVRACVRVRICACGACVCATTDNYLLSSPRNLVFSSSGDLAQSINNS